MYCPRLELRLIQSLPQGCLEYRLAKQITGTQVRREGGQVGSLPGGPAGPTMSFFTILLSVRVTISTISCISC